MGGGLVVVIDDYLAHSGLEKDPDVIGFGRAWMAKRVFTVLQFKEVAQSVGLELVDDVDLVEQYDIIRLNYHGRASRGWGHWLGHHQGFLGAEIRARLTVNRKIDYRMLVLRKCCPA